MSPIIFLHKHQSNQKCIKNLSNYAEQINHLKLKIQITFLLASNDKLNIGLDRLLNESNDYQTQNKHNYIFVGDELEGDYVD